ncbi:MAG: Gldg family protein [Candidatus Brachytrichaceae bacterium NZ_4S206]|jgi:ABC-2 type transport system permease protein
MKTILAIARKEWNNYFSSPQALIFIGVFLAASLFIFFWGETFFARGVAEMRPLFRWMPLLLIFLVAALTMRQWSEEQRSGSLEMLLTLPVPTWQLVAGKFLAVMGLVALALALTLPLTFTVALLGNLDWGPVIGGYIAALLMASAYAAIGLFVSSRTDNQIVALIVTALVGGAFYLIGSPLVVDFVSGSTAEFFRALGTGSRFESIERGVIDLRDLAYYVTLALIFLTLNAWSLDRKRWSAGPRTAEYRRAANLTSGLVALNLVAVNVWMGPLQALRADLTAQREFSLSPATLNLLNDLQEPLLIRAYISEKTHPLLAPLTPRVRDMLREYQIAGRGQVTAEVVDPITDPNLEAEAARTYGIQPTPVQVAGRYEASLINTYFDILVRYGDQNTVLNFRDLIEVEQRRDGTIDVRLRNLEYDLTRAIKKVTSGFRGIESVFAALQKPARLTILVTRQTLPEAFKDVPGLMEKVAQEIQQKSGGKFEYQVVDPDQPNVAFTRKTLVERYGLQPTPVSLFGLDSFYLNMLLEIDGKTQAIYPEGDFTESSIRTAIESALKRNVGGFLNVIGLWTPPPQMAMFGRADPGNWRLIREQLGREYTVRDVDLSTGQVPPDVNTLIVIGPRNLDDKARYAIDQYLMQGGSVVIAGGNYSLMLGFGSPILEPVQNGLNEMLEHYGVKIGQGLVMDPQNEPFPVEVNRDIGGLIVRELQAVNYPFFVDVRPDGMDRNNPIVSRLPAVTMNFVSPIEVDEQKNANRKVTTLLRSTDQSWVRTDANVQPDFQTHPEFGFPVEGARKSRPLAVAIQGSFESFFKGRPSPLQATPTPAPTPAPDATPEPTSTPEPVRPVGATIPQSPDTARLVVIGSADFLNDALLELSSRLGQERYLNSLQFMQNVADWTVEDLELLDIRTRGTVTRALRPLAESERRAWEIANYVVVVATLFAIGVIWRLRQRAEPPMQLAPVTVPVRVGDARPMRKEVS